MLWIRNHRRHRFCPSFKLVVEISWAIVGKSVKLSRSAVSGRRSVVVKTEVCKWQSYTLSRQKPDAPRGFQQAIRSNRPFLRSQRLPRAKWRAIPRQSRPTQLIQEGRVSVSIAATNRAAAKRYGEGIRYENRREIGKCAKMQKICRRMTKKSDRSGDLCRFRNRREGGSCAGLCP
jgi:hypothetical protein